MRQFDERKGQLMWDLLVKTAYRVATKNKQLRDEGHLEAKRAEILGLTTMELRAYLSIYYADKADQNAMKAEHDRILKQEEAF